MRKTLDIVAFGATHRRRYLGAFGAYIATAAVVNLTISGFPAVVWLNALTVALVAVAWWSRRRAVQAVVTVAMLVLSAYYAVRFIPALE